MKKLSKAVLICISVLLFACSAKPETVQEAEETTEKTEETAETETKDELQDLTYMNGTMLYSTVLNMVSDPVHYDGQKMRVRGYFAIGQDPDGNTVYGCVIPDATACCKQGFLIRLAEGEFPEEGQWFDVEGTFRYEMKQFTTDLILEDARIIQIIG